MRSFKSCLILCFPVDFFISLLILLIAEADSFFQTLSSPLGFMVLFYLEAWPYEIQANNMALCLPQVTSTNTNLCAIIFLWIKP